MPTKKSLLLSIKGIKVSIVTLPQGGAIDISKASYGDTSRYTITQVGEELFEAKNYLGEKEYFSLAHVRHIQL